MHYRIYILTASIVAVLLTISGLSQSLIYKETLLVPLALWFPLVVVSDAREVEAVALSLIQFPLFATAFALGIRRWPAGRVIAALALIYATLAGVAFAIVTST